MKKKKGALLRAAEVFDVPGQPALGVPRVTVTGHSRVHIENHRGLIEYGPEVIGVSAGDMTIKLRGQRLEISAMSDMELVVTGEISGIELDV